MDDLKANPLNILTKEDHTTEQVPYTNIELICKMYEKLNLLEQNPYI